MSRPRVDGPRCVVCGGAYGSSPPGAHGPHDACERRIALARPAPPSVDAWPDEAPTRPASPAAKRVAWAVAFYNERRFARRELLVPLVFLALWAVREALGWFAP